jgi:LuxR family transcriptional regulator, maltose regulon positive regulatory protein
MPKQAVYLLMWSPRAQMYEVHTSSRQDSLHIAPESPAWFAWLEEVSSFSFHSRQGHTYMVWKEHVQLGGTYWYGYLRKHTKMVKHYLGRSADLTISHLEEIAALLNATESLSTPEAIASSGRIEQPPSERLNAQTGMLASALPGREEQVSHLDATPATLMSLPRDPLLFTKLRVPRLHTRLVSRSHLLEQLQQGMKHALTLVSAPAGFGKTTLLAQWLAETGTRGAWLTLEPEDNEPARFLSYVIAALQTLDPQIGTTVLPLLQTPQPVPLESMVALLINDITSSDVGDFALVLDEYHVIAAAAIHQALTYLVVHLSPQMHLFVATRADPPLPLARLRARGQLIELRAADLRFDPAEVGTFLQTVMGLNLPAEAIATLEHRTEGWVTGLQLAALSLRGRSDVSSFIAAFSGSHRYVLDYLSEEVLARQSAAVQSFLLHTAILEQLSGPLCEAVTGQEEGQVMLEALERANLFVVSLDDERRWYRYHHLFAEVLRSRLQQVEPTFIPALHRRASAWYGQNGLVIEAVHHALASADYERATHLVTRYASAFPLRIVRAPLRNWLPALPEDLVRARPQLCLILAYLLSDSGQLDTVDFWLRAAEARLWGGEPGGAETEAESGLRAMLTEVLAVRATVATRRGDIPQASEPVRQVGDHLSPDGTARARSTVALDLGTASFWSGDTVAASQAFAEASIAGDAAGTLFFVLAGLGGEGLVHIVRGELRQAAEVFRQVLRRAAGREGQISLVAGLAQVGLGSVLREWNDLERAEQHLLAGSEQATRLSSFETLVLTSLQLARIRQARGDALGALDHLARIDEVVQRRGGEFFARMIAACRAQLWLMQGNLAAAGHWAATIPLVPDQPINYVDEMERLAHVRVQIAQGRAADALLALKRLCAVAEAAGRSGSVLEILLLQALAQQHLGNTAQAIAQLAKVLALAEPEGYMRLFMDEGPPMHALLKQVLAAQRRQHLAPPHPSTASLEHLLATFDGATAAGSASRAKAPKSMAQTQKLSEPLKAGELTVLRQLATGKSTVEIAHELIVAPSTIKWYLKHLYAKLQVHSRTQAIARARELQLLE